MATPRALLVDPDHALTYHIVSRCVRRSWLCGWDKLTRRDYTHRKRHLEARLLRLCRSFAVELYGYAIMSNHFHLVVRYDPKECQRWSAGEVAARWVDAVSPDTIVLDVEQRRHAIHALCSSPERIDHVRQRLGSLSAFMQQLKQPIARQANLEDGVSGHFFDQRFYSGALLSEQALLAAMAYVDLNPVRARIAKDIDQCRHTSIARRLEENSPHRLENALAPLVSGIETRNDDAPVTSMTLKEYLDVLRALIALEQPPAQAAPIGPPHRLLRWAQNVAALRKRQRVFGNEEQLSRWLTSRNMRRVEKSLA